MEVSSADRSDLSLEWTLGVLRRRVPWVAFCVLLVAAAAYGFSKQQAKKYTATASLVFNNTEPAQQVAGLAPVGNGDQQALQATNLKLVELGDMAATTAKSLGHRLTKDAVMEDLSITAEGESNIVDVAATASSPALAAGIANTYTAVFVREQQNHNHAYYASALHLVEHQLAHMSRRERAGTAGLALEDRAQSLGVLAELRSGNVEVAQAATLPTSPSSPKTTRNTILGAILGLLLGLGVALLLERLDRLIREPKDLEAIYGLPLLGVVPESAALAASGKANQSELPPADAEAFQMIRAHLRYFNVDRELHTLLLTSAAPGDGKTTVARHLATAAAEMGSRVLLLEADLRRPTLAGMLQINATPGLLDVLVGASSLDAATQELHLGVSFLPEPTEHKVDILVAGTVLPPNPGELIESRAMERLLAQVRSSYDLVVIDTPPMTAVSDAFPLLTKVDGVVIVGRLRRNRRDVAERLHETLTGTGAPLLGVIANGLKSRDLSAYGYGYESAGAKRGGPPHGQEPAPAGALTPSNGAGASNDVVPAEQPLPRAER